MKSFKYSLPEVILLSLISAGLVFFSIGFWFPDPYISDRLMLSKKIVLIWIPRIGIPFSILIFLFIYKKIKEGKLSARLLLMNFGVFIILLFLCYPFVNIFYHQSFQNKKKDFHPHLVFKPNKLDTTSLQNKDRINIVALGGSTTDFSNSKGIGWPKMVSEAIGDDVILHNQGKGWYTSLHSLINYQTNIRPYKPDIILIMHGINDFLSSADFSYFSRGAFQKDYGHFFGPTARIMDHEDITINNINTLSRLWFHKKRKDFDDFDFKGLKTFEHNLNTLIDIARIDSSEVVLITQPTIYKKDMSPKERDALLMLKYEALNDTMRWSLETAIQGMNAYNETTRKIAKKRNVPLIDLEKKLPKTLDYFYDDCHYNDIAYPLIAHEISSELLRLNLFQSK